MSRDNILNRIRYTLIKLLAGKMPVILNVNISRPAGYTGALAYFPKPEMPGLIEACVLLSKERPHILSPTRDIKEPHKAMAEAERMANDLQAKIDALMLEYCSHEMTDAQKERWARHQQPVTPNERNSGTAEGGPAGMED